MRIILFAICLVVISSGGWIFSRAYHPLSDCPLRYRFEFETRCWVKDSRDGYKLIELYNYDSNHFWLARVSNEETVWMQHPSGIIASFNRSSFDNSIELKPGDLTKIIVNGMEFSPQLLKERP